jgi:TolA-binding protein
VNKNFPDRLARFSASSTSIRSRARLPDALLKVGYCDYELAQWDQAKKVLVGGRREFSDTPAGHLAQQRLDKLAAEKH